MLPSTLFLMLFKDTSSSCQEFIYHGNNIPSKWKNVILGKLDHSKLNIVNLPILEELKSRILKALDFPCTQKLENLQ